MAKKKRILEQSDLEVPINVRMAEKKRTLEQSDLEVPINVRMAEKKRTLEQSDLEMAEHARKRRKKRRDRAKRKLPAAPKPSLPKQKRVNDKPPVCNQRARKRKHDKIFAEITKDKVHAEAKPASGVSSNLPTHQAAVTLLSRPPKKKWHAGRPEPDGPVVTGDAVPTLADLKENAKNFTLDWTYINQQALVRRTRDDLHLDRLPPKQRAEYERYYTPSQALAKLEPISLSNAIPDMKQQRGLSALKQALKFRKPHVEPRLSSVPLYRGDQDAEATRAKLRESYNFGRGRPADASSSEDDSSSDSASDYGSEQKQPARGSFHESWAEQLLVTHSLGPSETAEENQEPKEAEVHVGQPVSLPHEPRTTRKSSSEQGSDEILSSSESDDSSDSASGNELEATSAAHSPLQESQNDEETMSHTIDSLKPVDEPLESANGRIRAEVLHESMDDPEASDMDDDGALPADQQFTLTADGEIVWSGAGPDVNNRVSGHKEFEPVSDDEVEDEHEHSGLQEAFDEAVSDGSAADLDSERPDEVDPDEVDPDEVDPDEVDPDEVDPDEVDQDEIGQDDSDVGAVTQSNIDAETRAALMGSDAADPDHGKLRNHLLDSLQKDIDAMPNGQVATIDVVSHQNTDDKVVNEDPIASELHEPVTSKLHAGEPVPVQLGSTPSQSTSGTSVCTTSSRADIREPTDGAEGDRGVDEEAAEIRAGEPMLQHMAMNKQWGEPVYPARCASQTSPKKADFVASTTQTNGVGTASSRMIIQGVDESHHNQSVSPLMHFSADIATKGSAKNNSQDTQQLYNDIDQLAQEVLVESTRLLPEAITGSTPSLHLRHNNQHLTSIPSNVGQNRSQPDLGAETENSSQHLNPADLSAETESDNDNTETDDEDEVVNSVETSNEVSASAMYDSSGDEVELDDDEEDNPLVRPPTRSSGLTAFKDLRTTRSPPPEIILPEAVRQAIAIANATSSPTAPSSIKKRQMTGRSSKHFSTPKTLPLKEPTKRLVAEPYKTYDRVPDRIAYVDLGLHVTRSQTNRQRRSKTIEDYGLEGSHSEPDADGDMPTRSAKVVSMDQEPENMPFATVVQPSPSIGPASGSVEDAALATSKQKRRDSAKKRKTTGAISEHFITDRVDKFTYTGKNRVAGVSYAPVPSINDEAFGLIQEKIWGEPFWLIIAVTFLNKTTGRSAVPVFRKLRQRWPQPSLLARADPDELLAMIHHLGLQNQRCKRIQQIAHAWASCPPVLGKKFRILHYPNKGDGKEYKKDDVIEGDTDDCVGAVELAHIPGCGRYAIDSWRIFCRDVMRGLADDYNGWKQGKGKLKDFEPEWKRVLPEDKELRACLRWMWLREGYIWDPLTGNKREASGEEMEMAVKGQMEFDDEVERKFAAQAAGVKVSSPEKARRGDLEDTPQKPAPTLPDPSSQRKGNYKTKATSESGLSDAADSRHGKAVETIPVSKAKAKHSRSTKVVSSVEQPDSPSHSTKAVEKPMKGTGERRRSRNTSRDT